MLVIPTAELVGCVADVLPFISPDKDDTEGRCVHLRWDGELFHASALSGVHMGISSWSDDVPPEKPVQGDLGPLLGSSDDPWELILSAEDATHLLSIAKPVKGLEYAKLFVECHSGLLIVSRDKQFRLPGFKVSYDGMTHAMPDVRELVVTAAAHVEPTKEIWFSTALLADYAKVRTRGGAMKLTFSGADRTTIVEIGSWFIGAIQPVRVSDDERASVVA